MIKICFFDLDGTVMDTLNSIAYFVNTTMEKMGLPEIETERFKYFAGDGRLELIKRSLEHNNALTDESLAKAIEIYDDAYVGNFMHLTKPFDGIKEEIIKIKDAGIKTAILSNKPDNATKLIIDDVFGKGFFEVVMGQRDGVPKKPNPAALLEAAKELGAEPEECAMVGDTNVDMQTGVNAGAHTVGVLWGFRPESELRENGAQHLAGSVDELAKVILGI